MNYFSLKFLVWVIDVLAIMIVPLLFLLVYLILSKLSISK